MPEIKSDLENFKTAIEQHGSTELLEEILKSGYRPDYTQVSLQEDILPSYSICYVDSEIFDVLAEHNALPAGISLATIKFVAYAFGNRKVQWEDFWGKADLNLQGINNYEKNPAVALATYGYGPYQPSIHPKKHYFELLASNGALPSGVSLSTLLYVACAHGNKEITWFDYWTKPDLNLEGIPGETRPMYLFAKRGDLVSAIALILRGLQHRPLQILDDRGEALRLIANEPGKSNMGDLFEYKRTVEEIVLRRSPRAFTQYYPNVFDIGETFLMHPTPDLDQNMRQMSNPQFTAFFAWAALKNKVGMFNSWHFPLLFNQDRLAARESVIVATVYKNREFLAKAIEQQSIDDATIVEAANVAAIVGDNVTLRLLLPRFKSTAIQTHIPARVLVDRNRGNPLFTAISNRHRDTVELLIKAGVTTRSISDTVFKSSCLQYAVLGLGSETVAILLGSDDIDVNQIDYDGNTALHTAAEKGYERIMQQLIDAGADRSLKNFDGKTALDLIADLELRGNMACYQTVVRPVGVARSSRARCSVM